MHVHMANQARMAQGILLGTKNPGVSAAKCRCHSAKQESGPLSAAFLSLDALDRWAIKLSLESPGTALGRSHKSWHSWRNARWEPRHLLSAFWGSAQAMWAGPGNGC